MTYDPYLGQRSTAEEIAMLRIEVVNMYADIEQLRRRNRRLAGADVALATCCSDIVCRIRDYMFKVIPILGVSQVATGALIALNIIEEIVLTEMGKHDSRPTAAGA